MVVPLYIERNCILSGRMVGMYYLCFSIEKIPDLTLAKYSVFDGSSVKDVMEKHGVFLRQLYRLGFASKVNFHLLFYYNNINPKGSRLSVILYATASDVERLKNIHAFIANSSLSQFYRFNYYDVIYNIEQNRIIVDDNDIDGIILRATSGNEYPFNKESFSESEIKSLLDSVNDDFPIVTCRVADGSEKQSETDIPFEKNGRIYFDIDFLHAAYITKKSYYMEALNRIPTDRPGTVNLYAMMDWIACDTGRLYQVLKLMEGYQLPAALRIDLFPVENTQGIRSTLPYTETRKRIYQRDVARDTNSEYIIQAWDDFTDNLNRHPLFYANIVAMSDFPDIAVMLADSVAAEAMESGTYDVKLLHNSQPIDIYYSDCKIISQSQDELPTKPDQNDKITQYISLFTLEELRPMFSLPILYPGENIEIPKETEPELKGVTAKANPQNNEWEETIRIGQTENGYEVTIPVSLLNKHAFIGGVPGSGKTNTMLNLVTTLWRDTKHRIPFLVLEPAKQEYRALAKISGMEDVRIFSPGADTRFPLHINPFEFPIGLTLDEHIKNLNRVFEGAFPLPMPTPMIIDSCIQTAYIMKKWNIYERNTGIHEYPTMQEFYDLLNEEVKKVPYQGETLNNIIGVLEVRIGSLMRRSIGTVYNVTKSSIKPEDWLNYPIIVELEALGEGPANFMSLLISTLIRETLKISKTRHISKPAEMQDISYIYPVRHIILYEEAHNLIGKETEDPDPFSVKPKTSATKYLVNMLAEVRALGEGIVIADQLPSELASQVMKNTGLKIGHRIVAEDDRTLLGSTMAASSDQLEEQGIFTPGRALVYYEGLQKPFKVQIDVWEAELTQSEKESPTDDELYLLCKDRPWHLNQLHRSSEIMGNCFANKINMSGCEMIVIVRRMARITEKKTEFEKIVQMIRKGEGTLSVEQKAMLQSLLLTNKNSIGKCDISILGNNPITSLAQYAETITFLSTREYEEGIKASRDELEEKFKVLYDKFESFLTFAEQYDNDYDSFIKELIETYWNNIGNMLKESLKFDYTGILHFVLEHSTKIGLTVRNGMKISSYRYLLTYFDMSLKFLLLDYCYNNIEPVVSTEEFSESMELITPSINELSCYKQICEQYGTTLSIYSENLVLQLQYCLLLLSNLDRTLSASAWIETTQNARRHISIICGMLIDLPPSDLIERLNSFLTYSISAFFKDLYSHIIKSGSDGIKSLNYAQNVANYLFDEICPMMHLVDVHLPIKVLSEFYHILEVLEKRDKKQIIVSGLEKFDFFCHALHYISDEQKQMVAVIRKHFIN